MMATVAQADMKPVLPFGAIAAYLACMLFLLLFQIFGEHVVSGQDIDLLNLVVPILFGTANLLLAWKLVRQSPTAIWNPLFWLLLACTLYYGLGQLISLLGHPDSVARVNTSYFVDAAGLARTNFLNTVGVTIIVGAYLGTAALFRRRRRSPVTDPESPAEDQQLVREAWYAMVLFLSIGLPVKYLLQMPADLGLLTWVLPGSIKYLGMLSGVALIPLYWLYRKRGGIYRAWFFALLMTESLASLTTLSKQRMIETALFVILGSQLVKPNIKKLAISGVLMASALVLVINPFVTFARVASERNWASAKDLSQVLDLVEKYQKKKEAIRDPQFPNAQLWWTRLAYSNAELFAMRQYDRGHAGTTFWLAPYTLIPRFIMPKKPGTEYGLQFTHLIEGRKTSNTFTGLGALGEGYWNGGWLGVAVVGLVIGILLALFYQFSLHIIIEGGIFMFLPIAMAGVTLGLRIDDWFVATYLGSTAQMVALYMAIQYGVRPMLFSVVTAPQQAPNDTAVTEQTSRRFPLVSG